MNYNFFPRHFEFIIDPGIDENEWGDALLKWVWLVDRMMVVTASIISVICYSSDSWKKFPRSMNDVASPGYFSLCTQLRKAIAVFLLWWFASFSNLRRNLTYCAATRIFPHDEQLGFAKIFLHKFFRSLLNVQSSIISFFLLLPVQVVLCWNDLWKNL